MGYYKRLASGQGGLTSREKRLKQAQASASGTGAVQVDITVDITEIVKEFERIGAYKGIKKDAVKEIHRKVAQTGARKMRQVVRDYPRTIMVQRTGRYGGRPGPDVEVRPGTLRRSIWSVDPGNGTNIWLAPRSSAVGGATPYSKLDAWYAHIVDAGQQFLGPGSNKGFFKRGLARATQPMVKKLRTEHARELNNHIGK